MNITKSINPLPKHGLSWSDLESQLNSFALDEIRGHFTRAFRATEDVQQVGKDAYFKFLSDNAFFSLYLPYIGDIETELLGMCVSLFHPEEDSTGSITSGGSESIYSAIHAAREWAKIHHPNIKKPEVIIPYSAHAAFDKACHYFELTLIRTPLAANNRADVGAMEQAITENTICLVGSAPCWSFAKYDPIEEIAALAEKHDLWMHTDACLGGYLAPFMEKLGHELPPWDFRVPGVKSISADLHKFGYCPKPASTILWRSKEYLDFHYVHPEDWPAGPYRMVGFAGSRSAGPTFAAWSVMKYLGEEGYLEMTRKLLDIKERITAGICAIEGLEVPEHDLMPLPFASRKADLEKIIGAMAVKGWILLGNYNPPLINMPLDPATDDRVIETFLTELREVTEAVINGQINENGTLRYG